MEPTFVFDKERSLKGCIADGWRIFAIGWRNYLKFLLPYLVLVGLTGAFVLEMLTRYATHHLLPAYRLHQTGAHPDAVKLVGMPAADTLVYILLGVLLFLVATYFCAARIVSQILQYRQADSLPISRGIRLQADERRLSVRLFDSDALFFAAGVVLTALFALAALKWSFWWLSPLPFAYVYLWSAANVCRMNHAFRQLSLAASLRSACRSGWLRQLVIQLVTLLPALVLWVISLLSPVIYVLTMLAGTDSLLVGDTPYLPGYVTFLFFMLNTLSFFAATLVSSIRYWPLTLRMR